MTDMAKHAGLPWDCILGAELARHYKPDPEVYQSAADFVPRPLEFGPGGKPDTQPDSAVDVTAADFNDLARQPGV
jgi:2-haloacid dehalogenase